MIPQCRSLANFNWTALCQAPGAAQESLRHECRRNRSRLPPPARCSADPPILRVAAPSPTAAESWGGERSAGRSLPLPGDTSCSSAFNQCPFSLRIPQSSCQRVDRTIAASGSRGWWQSPAAAYAKQGLAL